MISQHKDCVPPEMAQTPYGVMMTAPPIHTPECLLKTWALTERTGK